MEKKVCVVVKAMCCVDVAVKHVFITDVGILFRDNSCPATSVTLAEEGFI
jgi:hypothetical protein